MSVESKPVAEQAADGIVSGGLLPVSPTYDCPYLPGREARFEGSVEKDLTPTAYKTLLDCGFRRSGHLIYRQRCPGCRACTPIRVLAMQFQPTRSMRRVRRRNDDVHVTVGTPRPTDVKRKLYGAYLRCQHDGTMSGAPPEFEDFLYASPVDTVEFCYYVGERLAGVSIADRCPGALSSVYMYYDPDLRQRSMGTFSILFEIDYCRRHHMPYYYLGYYVGGSQTMAYKARFCPAELLNDIGRWVPFDYKVRS